jgi:hypothetical protein
MVDGSSVVDKVKFKRDVTAYANSIINEGSDLHLGTQASIPDALLSISERLADNPNDPEIRQQLLKELRKPNKAMMSRGNVDKNNSMEQHRALSSVDSGVIKDWAKDQDILDTLEVYSQAVHERIAYAQRFGANNEKLDARVRLAQLEGLESDKPISVAAMEKIYNTTDLQQRITAKAVSPQYKSRVKAIKTGVNLKTLGMATLSSLVEPMFLIPKVGGKPFVKGGIQAVNTAATKLARTFLKDIPESDRERAAVGMNTGFRQAVSSVSNRVGEDVINPNVVDATLFKYNLLAPWTELTRMWSQFAALEMFKQDGLLLQDLSAPKSKRLAAAGRLSEAGIDPNRVAQWERAGADPNDPNFKDIRAAGINVSEDIVFAPKPVNKPSWMSDPSWYTQLFGQLKTFPIAFTNKMAIPVANSIAKAKGIQQLEMAAKTSFAAGSVAVGFVMQDALKAVIRDGNLDKWEEKSPEAKAASAITQLGATSLFADPIASELHRGSALETIAGPAAGTATQLVGNLSLFLAGDDEVEDFMSNLLLTVTPNMPFVGILRDEIRGK